MWRCTDQLIDGWTVPGTRDMLDEMRRVALLILMDTLYGIDFRHDLDRLWQPILRLLKYISPGLWLLWRGVPRPGYGEDIAAVDRYLYEIIAQRRSAGATGEDLLDLLVRTDWMSDGLIRDQLLTMLIAGHDTGTALMAWTLYLLGKHPRAMEKARAEVKDVLGSADPTYALVEELDYLDRVVKESLRLYPPIHLGTRRALDDLTFDGFRLPADTRVLYSIYLTHRDPDHWVAPNQFNPDRFIAQRGQRTYEPYSYVPFGGGPRNCIGAMYGQIEAKVVLARLLQRVELRLAADNVRPYMGATLEPHPGVMMAVRARL
jgi:cytochrome P450